MLLRLEPFEERAQPSVAASPVMHPNHAVRPFAAGGPSGGPDPAQVRHAYGFDQLTDDGAGQTIAIVVAYDDPNIGSDLAVFDQAYGLPGPRRASPRQSPPAPPWTAAGPGRRPWTSSGPTPWPPRQASMLVEAKSASTSDLLSAVDYARAPGVSVVSMSWGGSESSFLGVQGRLLATPAGAHASNVRGGRRRLRCGGRVAGLIPNVLAVGGHRVDRGPTEATGGERAWSGSGAAGSAGCTRPPPTRPAS